MKYYLDKNQIERLASNKAVFLRGQSLAAVDAVTDTDLFNVHSDGDSSMFVKEVTDNETAYMVSIVFDNNNGLLRKFSCSCDAYAVWKGGCSHVVAVLLNLFEKNRSLAEIARSSRVSRQLLDAFEKQALSAIDKRLAEDIKPVNPVVVLPKLAMDYRNTPMIQLEIGYEDSRKYVVRDIAMMLAYFEQEREYSYGKNFSLLHSPSLLDARSRGLVDLLRSEQADINALRAIKTYYSANTFGARAFFLTPSGLDGFFGIFEGCEIAADRELNMGASLALCTEPPDIKISVARMGSGETELTMNIPEQIKLISGSVYGYVLYGMSMHRVALDYYSVLESLIKAFQQAGKSTDGGRFIRFPAADARKLSTYMLPELRRHGFLSDDEGISEYLPQTLHPRVYLDAENGVVICAPAFVYNGTEIDNNSWDGIIRDIAGEYAFIRTLRLMGFEGDSTRLTLSGDDAVHGFYHADNGLAKLREIAEVFATDAFDSVTHKTVKAPSFGLRINGNLLEIEVSGDYTPSELIAALESYRLKKTYHKLTDGRYMDFNGSEDVYDQLNELFTGLDIRQKDINTDTISVPRYRALYAASQLEGSMEYSLDDGVKRLISDFSSGNEVTAVVPEHMDAVLRGYQKEGFLWLMTLSRYGFGGILADDMGLGKTIQVIAVLLWYKENTAKNERLPSMVVAPTSLIYNWEKEIARFAPELNTAILSGAASKRKEEFLTAGDIDVYITTYDMLKRDIQNYSSARFRYVIADEAQNIKNPGTLNAKAVKMLNAEVRFALTGTPIENALSELWSIFDFILPGYLYSAGRFTKVYEAPILKNKSKQAAENLRRQISPFILRRLKSDVLTELPDKVETTLYADMSNEQRLIYDSYLMKAKGELEKTVELGRFNESRIEILSMLTRLRQICCHPATFVDNYNGGSGKLDLTIDIIDSSLASGHRILVFSQFTKMLSILTERLDNNNVSYFYLDGQTPSKERLEMTEAFNSGERGAFLISLKAGGAGLNLTGADVVIHYDPWWNPAVMAQASDRAHRFGQTRMVQVFNIVTKDTIEEKIIALQGMKKDLVDTVIEEGSTFISKLDKEEILELFK